MSRKQTRITTGRWLLAVVAASLVLWAEGPATTLNLASVAKLAESDNLAVRASRQAVEAARQRLQQARAARLGKLTADAEYLRFSEPLLIYSPAVKVAALGDVSLAVPPTLLAPQDNAHVRLMAGVPLFTGGQITNTIRAAQSGERATEFAADDTRMANVFDAERFYLGSVLAGEVVRLNEEALRSYEQHWHDAQVAYRMGVVANYDLIRAETAVREQEKRLTEARNQRDVAEAALRTSLAMSADAPVTIAGRLFETTEPLSLAQAQQQAEETSPLLLALSRKADAARRTERVAQGNYLPTVTAIAGKELITTKIAQTDPHWFAGVQANLTLFEGGARRARVAEKAAEAAQARIEYEHARDQVQLAIHTALLELDSQRSALTAARKAEALAAESLRLATKRFSVGTGTSLEVLDANLALTGARIGVQTALYRIDVAYLQTHRYLGDIVGVAAKVKP